MLQTLQIKNFVLIDKLELDFSIGFNVITGETGAGKSILLDALLFCLGKKTINNIVRPGADFCSVSCIFTINKELANFLISQAIEYDEQIIVKRVQSVQGRKKAFINDNLVSTKTLKECFDILLEIHGQHNHTLLLNTNSHIEIIDEYGKLNITKNEVGKKYKDWLKLEKDLANFLQKQSELEQEISYLQHICTELEQTNIIDDEEEKLSEIKKILQNKSKYQRFLNDIYSQLEQSNFAQIVIRAQKNFSQMESNDVLTKINNHLEDAYDQIEDAQSALSQIINDYNIEDHSLEDIDNRLYEIRSLARKHNVTVNELSDFLKESITKLNSLETIVSNKNTLKSKTKTYKEDYIKAAQCLSQQRKKYAKIIEQKTIAELSLLEINKAKFKVLFHNQDEYLSEQGIDQIEFIATTNPGIALLPINKIASGGELSRFMLAFRAVLFNSAPKNTIIFDEIDVGISGSVADSIGNRLKNLSKTVQTVVITHQPQIAGKADCHILVKKFQTNSGTCVKVNILDKNEKALELARMISGQNITKASFIAAKELLE